MIVKSRQSSHRVPIAAPAALTHVHDQDAHGHTAPASTTGKATAMTTAHVPSLSRPPRRTTRQLGAIAAGIALVLLVAAGLLLWQLTRDEEATGPTEAELATPAAPAIAARDQPVPAYFIVADQAQADAIQRGLDNSDATRAAQGEAPLTASVVLFPSVEAEVQFWSTMGEQALAGQGLNADTVVDLRTPAARVTTNAMPERAGE